MGGGARHQHGSRVARETRRSGPPERTRAPAAAAAPTPPLLAMRSPSPPRRPGAPGSAAPSPSGQSPETEAAPPPGGNGEAGSAARPTPPHPLALMPTNETLARALGGGSPDYLPDVEEGEDTALNAKKWKF